MGSRASGGGGGDFPTTSVRGEASPLGRDFLIKKTGEKFENQSNQGGNEHTHGDGTNPTLQGLSYGGIDVRGRNVGEVAYLYRREHGIME